jgi:hypothetical protein
MNIAVNKHELQDMIWCSFRYALGRKTYITAVIADLIKKYSKYLNSYEKAAYAKEILQAIKDNNAGMETDVAVWRSVLDLFKEEKIDVSSLS